ncbi:MAG: tetratricopeptide repeat protein [Proteobacteria bacterium]|nr:tetratricopeptide repeat protein [Pseudomonadota bacterium]
MMQNATVVFKEAKKLIATNRLEQAKVVLQPLITELNNDYRVYSMLGFIYHKQGLFSRAVKNYRRALEINNGDIETAINLSLVYNDLGKYEEGAALYAKAVGMLEKASTNQDQNKKDDDEDINIMFSNQHTNIGELYLRYNRAEDAYVELEKAIKLYPYSQHANVEMAECLSRLGKRKQAIKNLKNLKLKCPEFFDTRVKLGHLLFLEGEIGYAIEEWDEVLKLDPDNMEAKMYMRMAKEESILP